MILSVSRRTDIPAFYADWLFHRLRAGFVCVRNPVNPRKISKIQLSPDVVDGIVFWTKNPAPMLPRLQELKRYAYYFQFTLTPYGKDIEPNLPVKLKLMSAFRRLSDQIGPERVIWRYDPILDQRERGRRRRICGRFRHDGENAVRRDPPGGDQLCGHGVPQRTA